MKTIATLEKPVRAAVFVTVERAECAVSALMNVGFSVKEITVICSDETKEKHFRPFEHEQPAGSNTPLAATVGGALGALIFGATVVGAGIATGGAALIAAGGGAMWFGGMAGGFVGAMLTRGFEHEAANYYDQAVSQGKILVAAEVHGPQAPDRLKQAEQIFADCGAEPVPLSEG